MCLFPKLIRNPKYKVNKKNGGNAPVLHDKRIGLVPIGCQKCIECMKQKRRTWQTRLYEDIKVNKNGKFVTLTFSNESYTKLAEEHWKYSGYELDNKIATVAVRRFMERWRKKYKVSVRHWLITELGSNGTENIHLHGIIWTDKVEDIKNIWYYGFVWTGNKKNERTINYVNEKTINYITKYMVKTDVQHKLYRSIILTSAGIGSNYVNSHNYNNNKYKGKDTIEAYTSANGNKIALPIYYRNKLYTEEEREQLWINKLNENVRYVMGNKIDVSKGYDEYLKALKYAQYLNRNKGYGGENITWEEEQYEREMRMVKQNERMNNKKNN